MLSKIFGNAFTKKTLIVAGLMGLGSALTVLFPKLATPIQVIVQALASMVG